MEGERYHSRGWHLLPLCSYKNGVVHTFTKDMILAMEAGVYSPRHMFYISVGLLHSNVLVLIC